MDFRNTSLTLANVNDHQENTEQQWCASHGSKEKAIVLRKEHCCSSTVCYRSRGQTRNLLEKADTNRSFSFFFLDEMHYVLRRKNNAFQQKNLIPSVKHGSGCIMVWASLGISGLESLP